MAPALPALTRSPVRSACHTSTAATVVSTTEKSESAELIDGLPASAVNGRAASSSASMVSMMTGTSSR
ncbi:hypothetical protein L083_1606 [Actinoplanes sp. N902-109]|nr:hypothetical protein L083_1606 [Actinoplanes sp. N902-109]